MEKLGIYIHIPFCKKKCKYCDFISFSCFEEKEEVIPSLGHVEVIERERVDPTCTDIGYTEQTRCSRCNQIVKESVEIESIPHIVVDNVCTMCNNEAFEFVLNEDGESYSVSRFSKVFNIDCVIHPTYKGKPVTGILEFSFDMVESLRSIHIPSSITYIDENAFSGCRNLMKITIDPNNPRYDSRNDCNAIIDSTTETLFIGCNNTTIPEGVRYIADKAFEFSPFLKEINIPASMEHIEPGAFYYVESLTKITVDENNNIYDSRDNCNAIIESETNKLVLGCKNSFIPEGVSKIGKYAFTFCKEIKEINIPDSVIEICEYAFEGCGNLEKVTFGNNIKIIGVGAFSLCESLQNISLPDSLLEIHFDAFSGCKSIKKVSLGKNIKSIEDYTFASCESLESIEMTDSVTSIEGGAFSGCSLLKNVRLSENLTKIGNNAFNGCTILETIDIPSKVSYIGDYAFGGCSSLKKIVIPEGITAINQGVFYMCNSLINIVLPSTITHIHNEAFAYCWELYDISLPQNISFISPNAFNNCSISYKLYDNGLYLGSGDNPYCYFVKAINEEVEEVKINEMTKVILPNAFYNCKALKNIIIPNTIENIGYSAFDNCYSLQYNEYGKCLYLGNDDNPYLVLVKISDFSGDFIINDNTKYIYQFAFLDCYYEGRINIPCSVRIVDDYAFYNTNIESIVINEGLEKIGQYAFEKCYNLKTINLPESLKEIGLDAFSDCKSLTSIYIPKNVEKIGSGIFKNCFSLESIKVDSNNEYYDSRDNCNAIIETYNNNLLSGCNKSTIPDTITSISEYAFYGCEQIAEVNIPEGVVSIGERAFYCCKSLKKIMIPSSVVILDAFAFQGCTSITQVIIEEGIKSLNYCVFGDCTALTTITIPKSVKNISEPFSSCDSLKEIKYRGTISQWDDINKTHSGIPNDVIIIYNCE